MAQKGFFAECGFVLYSLILMLITAAVYNMLYWSTAAKGWIK